MASEGMRKLWCLANRFVSARLVPHGEPLISSFARFLLNKNNVPVISADDLSVPLIDPSTGKLATALIPSTPGLGDLVAANNLSDLINASTARANLGLGTAATHASTEFDVAGAADDANATRILSKAIVDVVTDGKYLKYDASADSGNGGWVMVDAVSGNPFDQELNTTDAPSFTGLTVDGNTFDESVLTAAVNPVNGAWGLLTLDGSGNLTVQGTNDNGALILVPVDAAPSVLVGGDAASSGDFFIINGAGNIAFRLSSLSPTNSFLIDSSGNLQLLAEVHGFTDLSDASSNLWSSLFDGTGGSVQLAIMADKPVNPVAPGNFVTTDGTFFQDSGFSDLSFQSVNGNLTAISAATPIADGTYTVGLGVTNNGTVTTVGGIITAITQAS